MRLSKSSFNNGINLNLKNEFSLIKNTNEVIYNNFNPLILNVKPNNTKRAGSLSDKPWVKIEPFFNATKTKPLSLYFYKNSNLIEFNIPKFNFKKPITGPELFDYGFFFPSKKKIINNKKKRFKKQNKSLRNCNPLFKKILSKKTNLFKTGLATLKKKTLESGLGNLSSPNPTFYKKKKIFSRKKKIYKNVKLSDQFSKKVSTKLKGYLTGVETYSSLYTGLDYNNTNWQTKKTPSLFNFKKKKINDKTIQQVRFKPGIATQWRFLRQYFKITRHLKLERQKRVTKFVVLSKGVCGFNLIKSLALSFGWVIKQAALFNITNVNPRSSWEQIYQGFWLLNGTAVYNPFIQLYRGDVIIATKTPIQTLPITKKMRWSLTRKWQLWGLDNIWNKFQYTATPWYLEVDELTKSITLLNEPFKFSDFDPAILEITPFLTYRLYNWKYIN